MYRAVLSPKASRRMAGLLTTIFSQDEPLSNLVVFFILVLALFIKLNEDAWQIFCQVLKLTWICTRDFLGGLHQRSSTTFLSIFILRYARLVISIIAFRLYRPIEPTRIPLYRPADAHVIISTVNPLNDAFEKCVRTILQNQPGQLTISVGGQQHIEACDILVEKLREYHGTTKVAVVSVPGQQGNKRKQMRLVLDHMARSRSRNTDKIVVFVDDHAWWPNPDFLQHVLAPFEDDQVGLVGMQKRVSRNKGSGRIESFINFLGCVYLERHNFDIAAQYTIDGGAFVISGRTCAIRASIAMDKKFREGFTNEKFFFGKLGPLHPDDDCYITRWVTTQPGLKIVFQYHPKCIMHTTLGERPDDGASTAGKFKGQLLRWARSSWRSDPRSLCDPMLWQKYWCWSALIYVVRLFNLAAVWDFSMLWVWSRTDLPAWTCLLLVTIIIGSKVIKLLPHFERNPEDVWFFPAYICFAYAHSFIRLYALLTFWDGSWSGRKLPSIEANTGATEVPFLGEDPMSDYSYDTPPNEEYFIPRRLRGPPQSRRGLSRHERLAWRRNQPIQMVPSRNWNRLSVYSDNEDEEDIDTPPQTPLPFPYDLSRSTRDYSMTTEIDPDSDWQNRIHYAPPMPPMPKDIQSKIFRKNVW